MGEKKLGGRKHIHWGGFVFLFISVALLIGGCATAPTLEELEKQREYHARKDVRSDQALG